MTAVIVGGDYIKPIEKVFAGKGVKRVEHWTGRKAGDLRKTLPLDTALVVLLCDYVNHSLAKKVRDDADRRGFPVIYCRRSLGQFCRKLDNFIACGGLGDTCDKGHPCCKDCLEGN